MTKTDQQQQQQQRAASPQQQQPTHPFRIRTVTVFLNLPADVSFWEREVAAAGAFLRTAVQHFTALGYEIQTTRIATQPFPEYLHGSSSSNEQQQQGASNAHCTLVQNAIKLEQLAAMHGIHLVSIGSSSNPEDLTVIPHVITSTKHVSCSFALPEDLDHILARKVAAVIMQVAAATEGMGNFRFAAASNIQPGIPYFPVAAAAAAAGEMHRAFALGTECDALLHNAFATAAAGSSSKGSILAAAKNQLAAVLQQHLGQLEAAALDLEAAAAAAGQQQQQQRFTYLGIDTSIAPGLDTPSLTSSYELLGLGKFGSPGSLTVSSLITNVLKSLNLKLTGYCGLMLAVCEDQGLAAAAATGSINISQLLQYSAVCGCGLDTVPVPGPTRRNRSSSSSSSSSSGRRQQQSVSSLPNTAAAADGDDRDLDDGHVDHDFDNDLQTDHEQTSAAAAADGDQQDLDHDHLSDAEITDLISSLLLDVNTLAYGLRKPLACRLLPLPGRSPGDDTGFSHPYMINSKVMDLRK